MCVHACMHACVCVYVVVSFNEVLPNQQSGHLMHFSSIPSKMPKYAQHACPMSNRCCGSVVLKKKMLSICCLKGVNFTSFNFKFELPFPGKNKQNKTTKQKQEAQLVRRLSKKPGEPVKQVQIHSAAWDFSPRINVHNRLSYGVHTAPMRSHVHQHLCTR